MRKKRRVFYDHHGTRERREYTKSDEKILEFMESHTDEFLFMSIGEVAKRLEVSEATISEQPDIWDTGTLRK